MDIRMHAVENDASAIKRFLQNKTEPIFQIQVWLQSINRFSEYHDYKIFFIYMYDPLNFDLITLKSNQFIGSARYKHVQILIVIHLSVLTMRSRAIFAFIMSPMTSWPQNLFSSLALQDTYMTKVLQ